MLWNLMAERTRNSYTNQKFAEVLRLSSASVGNKIAGRTEFTRQEMLTLRDKFFPELSLDYLFSDKAGEKHD